MANENQRDVELRLAVKTQGAEAVNKLGKEIRDLGKQAGDAAPEFVELANQVEKIGDQLQAVDALAGLNAEVKQLTEVQGKAVAEATALGEALGKLRAASEAADAAEAKAKATLTATQEVLTRKRLALDELKLSTDAAGKTTESYREKSNALKQEILDARKAIVDQKNAFLDAQKAADTAEGAEKKLAVQYGESSKAATTANQALEKRSEAMRQAQSALEAQGVATSDLAAAQGQLVNELLRVDEEARAYDAQLTALREESEKAAQAARDLADAQEESAKASARMAAETEAAFKALGIKPVRDMVAELARLEAALEVLARDTSLPDDAFLAAYTAASEKVLAFRREIDGTAQAERNAAEALAAHTAATEAAVAEQNRLVDQLEAAQLAFDQESIDRHAAALRDAASAADKTAKEEAALAEATRAVDAAFATLGVRNSVAIVAEIDRINAAMRTLAGDSTVSASDFAKAYAAAQTQIAKLTRELNGVPEPVENVSRSMEFLRSTIGQFAVGNLIGGIFQDIASRAQGLAGEFFKTNIQAEGLRRSLTQITGSVTEAERQFELLRSVSNRTGTAVGEITQSFTTFTAAMRTAGYSAQTTEQLFTAVASAAGNMGLSSEKTGLILNALGQIASKGKVSLEELQGQLGESLPGAMQVAADAMGLPRERLVALIESGNVLARDLLPYLPQAMAKAFGDSDKQVVSFAAAWNRLKNAVTEATQAASTSAGWRALTTTLDFVASKFDVLLGTVTAFGKVYGALKLLEFANGILGIGKATETTTASTTSNTVAVEANTIARNANAVAAERNAIGLAQVTQATTANTAAVGANAAATVATGAAQAGMLSRLTSVGSVVGSVVARLGAYGAAAYLLVGTLKDTGVALGEWVAKHTDAGRALEANEKKIKALEDAERQRATVSSQSVLQIQNAYLTQTKAAEIAVAVAEKSVKATQEEGVARTAIAKLMGNEVEERNALADAYSKNAVAATDLARVRKDEADTLGAYVAKVKAVAEANRDNSTATKDLIRDLQKKADVSKQEAEQAAAAAEAAKTEAAARRVAAETLKDNSGRVNELAAAYELAQRKADIMKEAEKAGIATHEQSADAARDAAAAHKIYADSIEDVGKKIERTAAAKQADLNLANARISVAQQEAAATLRVANALGNEQVATEAQIRSKYLEIDAINSKIQSAKVDYEQGIASIENARRQAQENGTLTKALEDELATRLKNIQAKYEDAKGSAAAVAGINAEIDALRRKQGAGPNIIQNTGGANDGLPVGATDNGDGTYNDAFGRKIDKATGQDKGAAASKSPFSGAQPDYTNRNDLTAKFKAGTLTVDDAAAAAANLQAAKANQAAVRGVAGAKGFDENVSLATAIVDAIKNKIVTKTSTVNINVGGKTTSVATSSDAEAQKLVAALKLIEQASGRS